MHSEGKSEISEKIWEKVKALPHQPGVYIMLDENRRVIYVGKSRSLKNRVTSYFQNKNSLSAKTAWMVSQIADFETINVDSEMESLILENNLIKQHRPFFNIMMRDSKMYPLLEITTGEEYPRMRTVRRSSSRQSSYFGPYPDVGALKRVKKLMQKIFRIRTCKQNLIVPLERPCLNYHIRLCTGPCARMATKEQYALQVKEAVDFLNGHTSSVVDSIKDNMALESKALNFERCAILRDTLRDLLTILEKQKVMVNDSAFEDYIAIVSEKHLSCAVIWQIREGKLLGQHHFILSAQLFDSLPEKLEAFIQQYYSNGQVPPPVLYTQCLPENSDLLSSWLSESKNTNSNTKDKNKTKNSGKVNIKVPQRGIKKELLSMCMENARKKLEEEKMLPSRTDVRQKALEELKEALNLQRLPLRIECVDISNIQGKYAVGSLVVFEEGLPLVSNYRHFKIKGMDTPNDFAMMKQVLRRRFKYCADPIVAIDPIKDPDKETKDDLSLNKIPDLLIVDGGKGQLGIAIEVISEFALENKVKLAGLAKENEELFLPFISESVRLRENSQAYLMVTHIRDEAHRFAITHHRKLRSKGYKTSALDDIPGVGKNKKRALNAAFADITKVRQASKETLARVPGIGPKLAEVIYMHLHEKTPLS